MKPFPTLFSFIVLATTLYTSGQTPAATETKLPAIFGSHMVLQQGQDVKLWGWDKPGTKVSISFADQTKESTAGADGKWEANLAPLAMSAEGRSLVVKGTSTITLEDVLVGEVWICSGQSNMAWTVGQSQQAAEEIKNANFPHIRLIKVPNTVAHEPQPDFKGSWSVCTPETAGSFTAVGYFFAREIHQKTKIPVGLISTNWGGTRVEAWTSQEALKAIPEAKPVLDAWARQVGAFDANEAKTRFENDLKKWEETVAATKKQNAELKAAGKPEKPLPKRPSPASDPKSSQHHPSALYNGMIAPIIGFGVRGAIWYQGESNASRAIQYRTLFPTLIKDWRARWGQDFPFYWVQLANFMDDNTDPNSTEGWTELQEAQLLTLSLPNTGMAVANDIGDAKDIHPKNKQEVGRRLSLWALSGPHGQKEIVPSGPLYEGFKVEGNKIRLTFRYTGQGLASRDGKPLARFAIAGEDQKFVAATAEIDGDTVLVWAEGIAKPSAVRYAWESNPIGANLGNKEGLPASCFRTDDWPVSSTGKEQP